MKVNKFKDLLKEAVREVLQEELNAVKQDLLESLQSNKSQPVTRKTTVSDNIPDKKLGKTSLHEILSKTEPLRDDDIPTMNFSSRDAQGFGHMRSMMAEPESPAQNNNYIIDDAGVKRELPADVASFMTKDYSALLKKAEEKDKMKHGG